MANDKSSISKPDWWPRNPYPIDIFPMPREQYPNIVPNPELRTALSGMLGREFWDIASEAIWMAMMAMLEAIEDDCLVEEWLCPDCSNKLLKQWGKMLEPCSDQEDLRIKTHK